MEDGNTAMLLQPSIGGLKEAGAEVELFYAGKLNVGSCDCKDMYCWTKEPGICCLSDDSTRDLLNRSLDRRQRPTQPVVRKEILSAAKLSS
jgi:multimeric flavodoxin WrbA